MPMFSGLGKSLVNGAADLANTLPGFGYQKGLAATRKAAANTVVKRMGVGSMVNELQQGVEHADNAVHATGQKVQQAQGKLQGRQAEWRAQAANRDARLADIAKPEAQVNANGKMDKSTFMANRQAQHGYQQQVAGVNKQYQAQSGYRHNVAENMGGKISDLQARQQAAQGGLTAATKRQATVMAPIQQHINKESDQAVQAYAGKHRYDNLKTVGIGAGVVGAGAMALNATHPAQPQQSYQGY